MLVSVRGKIWLISGAPGAGKSETARALALHYPKAVHIPVDDLREFVVSGYASPLDAWTAETRQQFALARAAAARMAGAYARAGFGAVIDDVAREADMPDFLQPLAGEGITKVLLSPRVEVAVERNRVRTNKTFDSAILAPHIARLHRELLEGCRPEDGWLVIDNSGFDVAFTVGELLRRIGGSPEF